jgi:hypothetical protein
MAASEVSWGAHLKAARRYGGTGIPLLPYTSENTVVDIILC